MLAVIDGVVIVGMLVSYLSDKLFVSPSDNDMISCNNTNGADPTP